MAVFLHAQKAAAVQIGEEGLAQKEDLFLVVKK
jgi:hypothetical protein